MKKAYLGVSAFLAGMALTAVIAHETTVFAAAKPDPANMISGEDIVIDYATQTLEVTTTDPEVMVAFPTVKITKEDPDDEGEITSIQIKKWDVYDGSEGMMEEHTDFNNDIDYYVAKIDLSSINITKGGYVAVRTNARNNSVLIHFNGVRTKLSASYDQEEDIVNIIDKANDGEECDSEEFEYKTQYGSWQSYYDSDNDIETSLKRYSQQGATLYFREKCSVWDNTEGYISRGKLTKGTIAKEEGYFSSDVENNYYMYEAQLTFAGKELKVKVPKFKDGPTVKLNYAKRTITVKKNIEYRQDVSAKFVAAPQDKNIDVSIGDEAGVLEVRTLPVSGKKYTPASKIARYEYPASRKLKLTEDANGYVSGMKAGDLTITYDESSKKIICSSVDTENTYLVYVVAKNAAAPVAGDKVAATVKPTTDVTKPKTVTLAASKMPVGSQVYVAYAADTKTKQWATAPVLLGTVE